MRRLIIVVAILVAVALPVAGLVGNAHAVDVTSQACQGANSAACSKSTGDPLFGPDGILTTVVNVLSVIAGVISVFVMLIAGVKMITSGGDSNSVHEARNAILYAVISLVIVASAQIIVRFILSKIG